MSKRSHANLAQEDELMSSFVLFRRGAVRVFVLMLSCVALNASLACNRAQQGKPDVVSGEAPQAEAASSAVDRGRYLVTVGGCNDCHTPLKMGANGPEPDTANILSGHPAGLQMPEPPKSSGPWAWSVAISSTAFAGPWGVSYAINLTPDQETGIGSWSEQVFVNALKTGRHMGVGRPILPPMPWGNLAKATDEDLKAIYAYLMSVPAKKNQVPDAVIAPPETSAPAASGVPAAPGVAPVPVRPTNRPQ